MYIYKYKVTREISRLGGQKKITLSLVLCPISKLMWSKITQSSLKTVICLKVPDNV